MQGAGVLGAGGRVLLNITDCRLPTACCRRYDCTVDSVCVG
jgi:hypothetical protein